MRWKNYAPNWPLLSSQRNSASRPTSRSTQAISPNWIKPLKEDKREIFRAAADAQKIADMQLRFHPDYAAQIDEPSAPSLARPQANRRLISNREHERVSGASASPATGD